MERFAGVTLIRNVACRLRDGVILYADVYRPSDGADAYPVLLMRQPYGKAIASTVTYAHPSWYAQQGFIVVIQDVRGRGTSEGTFNPFVQEVADGYDAVEWAARLPGSNGKVGMYGFSYQGTAQWAAATARPPHLRAIAPAMCAANLYDGWFYPHGRFAVGGQFPWAAQLARDEARRRGSAADEERLTGIMQNPGPWLQHLPLSAQPDIADFAPFYRDWADHITDDDYWSQRNWLPALQAQCVPALHVGGWFDPFLTGTLQSFSALEAPGSASRGLHRLVLGPWLHIPWGSRVGDVDYGSEAAGKLDRETVNWFKRWLADAASDDLPSVRYFELGSKTWQTLTAWPTASPTEPRVLTWRLAGTDESANGLSGGGRLVDRPAPETGGGIDVLVCDARLAMPCDSYVPANRRQIQERREILVYTSQPLSSSLPILGQPKVTLFGQTLDGPTDVVTILSGVAADGTARFLSIGRAQSTDGATASIGSDDWHVWEILMRPVGVELQAGECLRLEVTGSAFPLFARHPNQRADADIAAATAADLQIATIAVGRGGSWDSRILLPIKTESIDGANGGT